MRAGERAAVYVTDPAYGYGEKGSFSFPSVPPSCQLVYEVDMIAWEPPAEVRPAGWCSAAACDVAHNVAGVRGGRDRLGAASRGEASWLVQLL